MSIVSSSDDLRPFERAMEFVLKGLPEHERRAGHRLPTTRELSSKIKVSPATVRNVYKHLADQGILSMGVGSGTFWVKPPQFQKRELVIGMNMKRFPDSHDFKSWSYRIYGGMLRAIFEHQIPLKLQLADPTENDRLLEDPSKLDQVLTGLDGFILVPLAGCDRLEAHLLKRNIPHVSLNPYRINATANFVSPDYYGASYALGRTLAQTGRKRVMAFLSPGDDTSISVQLRLAGFLAGLHSVDRPPEFRKLIIAEGQKLTAASAFKSFVSKKRWWPDAVYAAGDEMASAVWDVAEEAGVSVPDELSLIGGSGVLTGKPGERPLTSMLQPLERVGEDLIAVLEKMLLGGLTSVPGIYHPMRFACGTSTREIENSHLCLEGD